MTTEKSFIEDYRHSIFLKVLFILGCICALLIIIGISLAYGQNMPFLETYKMIWNHITGTSYPYRSALWWKDFDIWKNVMPRIALGILAGFALAVGGTIMQSIMSNPLADPYTTGISSGASFGAVLVIVLGSAFAIVPSNYGLIINAFLGAMVPALIIILVHKRVGSSPASIILIGTALSYFFNAMVTLLMVTATEENLQAAYLWQIGTLEGAVWADVKIVAAVTIVGCIISMLISRNLNLLTMGDNSAKSLGLDVEQFRILCLILLSILTATIISFTGILGFIGLVSPHITRLILGSDNRIVIPASLVVGATMMVGCDLISRMLTTVSIPVGVVISLFCSPIFLILVVGVRRKGGIY